MNTARITRGGTVLGILLFCHLSAGQNQDSIRVENVEEQVDSIVMVALKRSEFTTREGVKVTTRATADNAELAGIKRIGAPAIPVLAKYLRRDDRTKLLVMRLLGTIGSPDVVAPLLGVMRESKNQTVRVSALLWLGDAREEDALPIVKQAMDDEDPLVRQTAKSIMDTRWPSK
jgi:HEAT repeat protein